MNEIKSPEAQAFLRQVQEVINKIDELKRVTSDVKANQSTNLLQVLHSQLEKKPDDVLTDAHNFLKDINDWNQLPDKIGEATQQLIKAKQLKRSKPNEGTIVEADPCELGECVDENGIPYANQTDADAAFLASAILDGLGTAAELVADIAAASAYPFDTLVYFVVKAISDGINVAAKAAAIIGWGLQLSADQGAECEETQVQELLKRMCININTIRSVVSQISDKLDEVNEKLDIINQKLDVLIELAKQIKVVVDKILLLQIEEALSECKMLVTLYLPQYVSGSINQIQDIVAKLIHLSKISGFTVANAESYWKQGAAALDKGQNEKALEWFMLTYKQLQTRDLCQVPCPSDPCGEEHSPS